MKQRSNIRKQPMTLPIRPLLACQARADLLAEFWAIHDNDSYRSLRSLVDRLLERCTIAELDHIIAEESCHG